MYFIKTTECWMSHCVKPTQLHTHTLPQSWLRALDSCVQSEGKSMLFTEQRRPGLNDT